MAEKLPNKIKRDNYVIISLGLSLALIWLGFFLVYKTGEWQLAKQEKERQAEEMKMAAEKTRFFANLNLQAKAYVIYNAETNEIIAGQNENEVLPLASLSKLMTALVANDLAQPEARLTTKGNDSGLRKGERWQLASLSALTLVGSSNDGAEALAQTATSGVAFVDQMNRRVQELDLAPLSFTNPTGLDEKFGPSNTGSALAVAKLMSYLLKNKPELLALTTETAIKEKSLDNLNHVIINTNEIVDQIPGLMAGKTGLTNLAGGNLTVAANIGLKRPLVFVVLGSTQEGRFSDTKKLVDAALNYYSTINK